MKILVAIFTALLFSGAAAAATLEEDVNRYVKIFVSDGDLDVDAFESLAWMGISDPRVFDPIERRLIAYVQQGTIDKNEKNEIARSIRALGFSGQQKYAPTIGRFLSSRLYQRYAKISLEDLALYQKWNPIISNRTSFDPKYSDDVNRVLNMLHSDDFLLKKIGAKRVYFSNKDDILLETLVKEIRASYDKNDSQYSDSIAWMVKALGSAKESKYRPFLNEVVAKARDPKVVEYAKRGLRS